MSRLVPLVLAVFIAMAFAPLAAASPTVPETLAAPADDTAQGHLIRWVKVNYPKGQESVRTGQFVRVVLESIVVASRIEINMVPIGGGNQTFMSDDGQHDDGNFGDSVWGTNMVRVQTNLTVGYKRLMIYMFSGANLIDTGSVNVGVDNHPPSFLGPKVIYPVAQSHAKEGDLVRFLVMVNDTAPRMNVDAILVIDRSGSMCQPSCAKIDGAKNGSKVFVDQLKPNVDRAALFSFSDAVMKDMDFTFDKNAIKTAIDAIQVGGATAFFQATIDCVNYAKVSPRKGAIAACVVLTDGINNQPPALQMVLDLLANSPEIPVFTIGLGDPSQINEADMRRISMASDGGEYFHAPTPADLAKIYDAIVNLLINRPYPQSIAKVLVNTTLFAKVPTLEPMFDDGMHGDEVAGDDIYGSEWIPVNTKTTATIDVPIHAWDSAFNQNQTTVALKLDNTLPTVGPIEVLYQIGANAMDGHELTINAKDVMDSFRAATGSTLSIEKVVLNASSIGAGEIVMTPSGNTYSAMRVLVATGGATGEFQVDVTAIDGAGNTGTESGLVVVDNTPPKALIVKPAPQAYVKGAFRVEADVQGAEAPVKVDAMVMGPDHWNGSMDFDETTGTWGATLNADGMADGTYDVTVTVTEGSGNSATSASSKFRVDNTAPALKLTAPADAVKLDRMTGDLKFSFEANDMFAVAKVVLVKDGTATLDKTPPTATTTHSFDHKELTRPEDNGFHKLTVKAWDENGNEAVLEILYSVDNYGYQGAAWGVIVGLVMALIILTAFLTKPRKQKGKGGG